MKLDKYIVSKVYEVDINFGPTIEVTCLDMLITDSLKFIDDFVDSDLEPGLDVYINNLNL